MTYADNYNIRTTSVKFNDVGDALDGLITRNYAGLTTGTSTTYIATPSPAWDAYTTSGLVVIIPHVTNTGAATINISGLGAKDLRIGGAAIAVGVLQQNVPTIMAYTGSVFEVLLQNISIPIGQISAFAGASAPTGWLLCDGSSQSTTGAYAALYGVIGYTYGGSGASFNVPDLLRRSPVGKGSGDTLGGSDGVAYASRSMSHSHTVPAHYHSATATGATIATTTTGSGHGHSTHTSAIVDISHTHAATAVTGTIGPSGGHSHTEAGCNTGTSGTTPIDRIQITGRAGAATATVNILSTSSDHSHAVTGAMLSAAGQTLSTTNKSLTGTVGGSDGTHTHGVTGLVGLVTGGVNGDAALTSGTTSQQHLFVNYIIKV